MGFLTIAGGIYSSVVSGSTALTWTAKTGVTSNNIFAITYDGTYFVIIDSTGRVYTATNPSGTWTYNSDIGGQGEDLYSGSDGYVGCSLGSDFKYATDPSSTWTLNDPVSGIAMRSTCYFSYASKWLITGDNSYVYYTGTPPTSGWTATSKGTSSNSKMVRPGSTLACCVGDSGFLSTSSNGTSWTIRTSSFGTTQIYSCYYDNSIWVFGGSGGKIATSTDPTSSVTQNTNTRTWPYITKDFSYHNNLWVCVGYGGVIATTKNPAGTWDANTSGTTNELSGITYGNGYFVTAGNGGTILYASYT